MNRTINININIKNDNDINKQINEKKKKKHKNSYITEPKMDNSYKILWLCGIILAITLQNVASPVFQNHKTKEWTNLDNITFSFDCTHRSVGFYADMEYNCQIFHMCDEEGNRIPHLCANETSFNQEYRICDWDYNFNCTESPKWFYLNELTYATESPEDEDY